MATKLLVEDGVARLDAWNGKMRRNAWGDGVEAVCLMSALVPGAKSIGFCVMAGWPQWLAHLLVNLYDADTGVSYEQTRADAWAYEVAEALSVPLDYAQVKDRYLIALLEGVRQYDHCGVVQPVIDLIERRCNGENVGTALLEQSSVARIHTYALSEMRKAIPNGRYIKEISAGLNAAGVAVHAVNLDLLQPAEILKLNGSVFDTEWAAARFSRVDHNRIYHQAKMQRRNDLVDALKAAA